MINPKEMRCPQCDAAIPWSRHQATRGLFRCSHCDTHLAISLIKKRLSDAFGPEIKQTYEVLGEPTDYAGAAELAAEDKYQFQWWALGQVGARPAEQKKEPIAASTAVSTSTTTSQENRNRLSFPSKRDT